MRVRPLPDLEKRTSNCDRPADAPIRLTAPGRSRGSAPRFRDGRDTESWASALLAAGALQLHVGVAESEMHSVADEVAHLLVERAGDGVGHVDVLILPLPQPSERIREENAVAPFIAAIRAGAVERTAHPEQDRTGGHRGGDDFVGTRLATGGPQMASRNDQRATVSYGEVAYRPHAGQDHARAWHFEKL